MTFKESENQYIAQLESRVSKLEQSLNFLLHETTSLKSQFIENHTHSTQKSHQTPPNKSHNTPERNQTSTPLTKNGHTAASLPTYNFPNYKLNYMTPNSKPSDIPTIQVHPPDSPSTTNTYKQKNIRNNLHIKDTGTKKKDGAHTHIYESDDLEPHSEFKVHFKEDLEYDQPYVTEGNEDSEGEENKTVNDGNDGNGSNEKKEHISLTEEDQALLQGMVALFFPEAPNHCHFNRNGNLT